jgi:hypothetical protein
MSPQLYEGGSGHPFDTHHTVSSSSNWVCLLSGCRAACVQQLHPWLQCCAATLCLARITPCSIESTASVTLAMCRRVGVPGAIALLEQVRGARRKAYSECSKDQQAQDRAWLLANTAGNKKQLMYMVGDVLNLGSKQDGLAEVLMSCIDECVLSACVEVARGRHVLAQPDAAGGSGRELDVDTALALFFETDLSWHHYNTLTSVWRASTDAGDMKFPSKRRVYARYVCSARCSCPRSVCVR